MATFGFGQNNTPSGFSQNNTPINQQTRASFMMESSAYVPGTAQNVRNVSPAFSTFGQFHSGRIVVYANKRDDVDVCVKCFPKMSSSLKNRLNLQPFYNWRDRGHNVSASQFTCDICSECQSEPTTKLSIAISLVNSGLAPADISRACSRFDYNGTKNEFRNALQRAGYDNSRANALSELIFR
mmetsp:Transcript_16642/g.22475  ORF Transcript_16642/g.22475 Transcript_16642/m.22475 type:complete len:183 (+) Transcript_16642:33-581(+)